MYEIMLATFTLLIVLLTIWLLSNQSLRNKVFIKNSSFYSEQLKQKWKSDIKASYGIVFAAGGKYLQDAIKNILILRYLKCNLPITIVYADKSELDIKSDYIQSLITSLSIKFVNASDQFVRLFPELTLPNFKGFQLKPFAMLFSGFEKAILFDADTISFQDPTYLFETKEFLETGAIFFPDVVNFSVTKWMKNEFWTHYLQIKKPYQDIWQQESSCVVMDLTRQLNSLLYTCDLNYQYKLTYKFVHGDKDTWRAGCELAGLSYTFISYRPGMLVSYKNRKSINKKNFVQYDINGEILYVQGKDIRLNLQYQGFIEHPTHKLNIFQNTFVNVEEEKVISLPKNIKEILEFSEIKNK